MRITYACGSPCRRDLGPRAWQFGGMPDVGGALVLVRAGLLAPTRRTGIDKERLDRLVATGDLRRFDTAGRLPDPSYGVRLVAQVVVRREVDGGGLQDWVRDRLAAVPRDVRFRAQPLRCATGKVPERELRQEQDG